MVARSLWPLADCDIQNPESSFVERGQFVQFIGGGKQRIDDTNTTIVAAVLEVFRDDFRDACDFGIGPEVCIEPAEFISCRSAQRRCEHIRSRVDDRELNLQRLCLPKGLLTIEQGRTCQVTARACYGGDELQNCLMRQSQLVAVQSGTPDIAGDPLL